MKFALVPWIGAGTRSDPFRPAIDPPFCALDLRPFGIDAAVVAYDATTGAVEIDLGEDPFAALPAGIRRNLARRIEVPEDSDTTAGLLMTRFTPALVARKGSRWRRLWLRGVLLGEIPTIEGGAVEVTDDFNRANSTTLGGSWIEMLNDTEIVSNEVRPATTGGGDWIAIWGADLSNDDHYAEVDLVRSGVFDAGGGCAIRANTTDEDCLVCTMDPNANATLWTFNSGTFSQFASSTSSPTGTGTFRVRFEASGTDVTMSIDGTAEIGPTTQTSFATNRRAGLYIWYFGSGTQDSIHIDNFEAGSDAVTPPIELLAVGTRATTGTTTQTVAHPPHAAGDLVLVGRVVKPSTATLATETDWTQHENGTGGTGTQGIDTGPQRSSVESLIATGDTADTTFDQGSSPNSVTASSIVYRKGWTDGVWQIQTTAGDDATHGTGRSATGAAALDFRPGDVLVAFVASDTDATTAYTSPALTASGITFGATAERVAAGGAGTGQDVGQMIYEATVTAGQGSAAPSLSLSGGPSSCGRVIFVRLRIGSRSPGLRRASRYPILVGSAFDR